MIRSRLPVFLLFLGISQLAGGETARPAGGGQQPLTLDTRGLDAQTALREIAARTGLTLVASREVQGMLNVDLRDASLKDALTQICRIVGCEWSQSEGPSLLVLPLGPDERIKRMRAELRQLERERAEPEKPARFSLCSQGEDGQIEVLKIGGAANPTILKTKDGILRIWTCLQADQD
jgi:hypothetical protein